MKLLSAFQESRKHLESNQGKGNEVIEFDFHCKAVSAFFRGEIVYGIAVSICRGKSPLESNEL